jgi:hypothetical protein
MEHHIRAQTGVGFALTSEGLKRLSGSEPGAMTTGTAGVFENAVNQLK